MDGHTHGQKLKQYVHQFHSVHLADIIILPLEDKWKDSGCIEYDSFAQILAQTYEHLLQLNVGLSLHCAKGCR